MSNKVKNMRSLLLILFSAISLSVSAQTITVKGNVKDTSGEPVIGASVVEKGNTTNGTITDLDGNFSIKVDGKKTLVISYIGMKTQEVAVQGRKTINVQMVDDSKALDEVVVIGYGTVNKRDLTGSVASVSAKDLAAIPVASASEALTGKLAGVSVTTTEGSPDADIKIRVRGGGSLSQDNSPLYIVDGFPVSSISDIAPSEIQSIDVLKDASSTAIYGARGANGVIIITTKSGKEGKTQVDFGASFGFKQVTKLTEVLSPYDFVAYQREIGSLDYGNFADMDIWRSIDGTDYQDEMFGRTGNQQQYNINVSGGTKQMTYSVSYAHNEEKSIMLNSGFKKDNVNAKIKSELNKWMTLDFNARLSYSTIDGLGGGADTNESNAANSTVANATVFRPVDSLKYSDDDEENSSAQQKSPLERLLATDKTRNTFNQNYNVGLNWKPFKNWTFRSEFGYGWKFDDTEQYWGVDAVSNSKYGYNGQPQAYLLREKTMSWRNANTLTYDNKKLFKGRDKLNVLIGHEVSSSQRKSIENVSVAFPVTMNFDDMKANMGSGKALANQSTIAAKENILSFFGRVNYSYNDTYFGNVSYRRDASSRFAPENRWGNFWSASVAWMLTRESFMEDITWVNMLKFKASFGQQGNDDILYPGVLLEKNYYPWLDQYKMTGANGTFADGTLLYKGNPDITWETSTSYNIGADFGLFNNKLNGSIEYFGRKSKDMLYNRPTAGSLGYTAVPMNVGSMTNSGVEIDLNYQIMANKKFNWSVNLNATFVKNKINKLHPDLNGKLIDSDRIYEEGESMYRMYLVDYAGVDEKTGEALYWAKDDNGNAIKTSEYSTAENYKVATDDMMPTVYGGLGTTFEAYGFDASIQLSYQLGGKIYDTGYRRLMHGGASSSAGWNWHKDIYNAWTPENPTSNIPRLNASDKYTNSASTRWLTSSDYLSINNITVGYTLPQQLVKKELLKTVGQSIHC